MLDYRDVMLSHTLCYLHCSMLVVDLFARVGVLQVKLFHVSTTRSYHERILNQVTNSDDMRRVDAKLHQLVKNMRQRIAART